MAINIYEQCTNPVTGEIFKGISVTPYAFKMQWVKKARGDHAAMAHIHTEQDEIFYVNKGELRLLVNDKEHRAGPGEKIIVRKGKSHVVVNNSDELDITLEYRPALDYEKFLQCFEGLIKDGYVDDNGFVDIKMMAYFIKKMKCQSMTMPASIPAKKFKLMLYQYYLMGTLKGWGKLYKKYTE
jgi:hypothetical protein